MPRAELRTPSGQEATQTLPLSASEGPPAQRRRTLRRSARREATDQPARPTGVLVDRGSAGDLRPGWTPATGGGATVYGEPGGAPRVRQPAVAPRPKFHPGSGPPLSASQLGRSAVCPRRAATGSSNRLPSPPEAVSGERSWDAWRADTPSDQVLRLRRADRKEKFSRSRWFHRNRVQLPPYGAASEVASNQHADSISQDHRSDKNRSQHESPFAPGLRAPPVRAPDYSPPSPADTGEAGIPFLQSSSFSLRQAQHRIAPRKSSSASAWPAPHKTPPARRRTLRPAVPGAAPTCTPSPQPNLDGRGPGRSRSKAPQEDEAGQWMERVHSRRTRSAFAHHRGLARAPRARRREGPDVLRTAQ